MGYHACATVRSSSGVSRVRNRALPTVVSTALGTVNLGLERQIGRTGAAWSANSENYRIRWMRHPPQTLQMWRVATGKDGKRYPTAQRISLTATRVLASQRKRVLLGFGPLRGLARKPSVVGPHQNFNDLCRLKFIYGTAMFCSELWRQANRSVHASALADEAKALFHHRTRFPRHLHLSRKNCGKV